MTASRGPSAWYMLGALGAVVVVAAALGVAQSPSGADQARSDLVSAATATLHAAGYTEHYLGTSSQGVEELELTYQAPDRLSGYRLVAGRRSYLAVAGSTLYQATSVSTTGGTAGLRFATQPYAPASRVDPVQQDLSYALRATAVARTGDVYSFDVRLGAGAVAHFRVRVDGQYATALTAQAPGGALGLTVTDINAAPPASSLVG